MTNLPSIIESKRDALTPLCEAHFVERLFVFGSVLTDAFDMEKSDLDFLVELQDLPPLERGIHLIELWDALEELFNRKVDLLSQQPIENPYLAANIHRTKQLVYERAGEEIFS